MKGKASLQIVHEMKYQSMEWKLPKEPSQKKVKTSRSTIKVILTVFWDADGIILADFFARRRKHEQRILFRSHNVSKAGVVRKRRNKLRKGHSLLLQTIHRHIGQASPWQQ